MTDDELLASLPIGALTLFEEKWGRNKVWVECPTQESWDYACMLEDQGLLKMHHVAPPYFSMTERGEQVLPTVREFLLARKAINP